MERQFAARREEQLLEKMAAAGITGPAAEAAAEAATMAEHMERIQVANSVLADLTGVPPPALPADTRTIEDAVSQWKRERSPSRDAVYSAAFAVRVFKDLHGDVPLEAITRRHMAELMQALKDYPKGIPDAERKLPVRELERRALNLKQRGALIFNLSSRFTRQIDPDLTRSALISRYKDMPTHRPDLATAAKKFNMIDAAFELALSVGMIETNPAHGLKIGGADTKKAIAKKRLPFTDDDVVKLFEALDGADDDLRWVAILGLTTGARLNEIVQLRTGDVMREEEHVCIDIHAESDDFGPRTAKNASSVRKLPLREEIGSAFARFAKIKGSGLIFPGYQTREGTSAKASKRVMRWIRGSVDDRRKVFHSFRHTLEDVARHCGIPKDMRYRITGHTDSDVGESYGTGYRISAVAEAVAKLRFPVDLKELVRSAPE